MEKQADERTPVQTFPWHAKTTEECFQELGCAEDHLKKGLSTEEAERRFAKYGANKLSEKDKKTLLRRIYDQVANILVGILVFVGVVSAIRGITATNGQARVTDWIEVGLIVFVIT